MPYYESPVTRLYQADARALPLEDESVQTVVTSPPYYSLRDYGIEPTVWGGESECEHEWGDAQRSPWANDVSGPNGRKKNTEAGHWKPKETGPFCSRCGAWYGTLGLEPTPDLYVEHMVEVFREVWRVLRPDGTLWLNLGDSYATQRGSRTEGSHDNGTGRGPAVQGNRTPAPFLKPKDLVGIPWRVAFALQADGWWLRSDIVWAKGRDGDDALYEQIGPGSSMPGSQRDRPSSCHEYLFLLTKAKTYYYDDEAVRVKWPGGAHTLRDVWFINSAASPIPHFATFPEALVEPCILAGTSERGVCAECGDPWERVVERQAMEIDRSHNHPLELRTRTSGTMTKPATSTTTGWRPTCDHDADLVPATVLDPFAGSGTVSAVAQRLGRHSVGVDMKAEYMDLAVQRISKVTLPMAVQS